MQKTALKTHGGGAYKARDIVSIMPLHEHYLESHFGGGSVLFAKDPANTSEIVNDVDECLMAFWYTLQQKELRVRLLERLDPLTPFARKEFEQAKRIIDSGGKGCDQVTIAWAIFTLQRQSRQALGRDFATLTRSRLRRGMSEQVSSWLSAIEGLPEFAVRLQRVLLECCDGTRLIQRQDDEKLLVYADPPFHPTTRKAGEYRREMTHEQHMDLWDVLGQMKGKFILSGYNCVPYEQKRQQYNCHRIDFVIDNKASSKREKDQVVESLWLNFEPEPVQVEEFGTFVE